MCLVSTNGRGLAYRTLQCGVFLTLQTVLSDVAIARLLSHYSAEGTRSPGFLTSSPGPFPGPPENGIWSVQMGVGRALRSSLDFRGPPYGGRQAGGRFRNGLSSFSNKSNLFPVLHKTSKNCSTNSNANVAVLCHSSSETKWHQWDVWGLPLDFVLLFPESLESDTQAS